MPQKSTVGGSGSSRSASDIEKLVSAAAVTEYTGGDITNYRNGHDYVFVDFNASWCGPCRQFGPIFHEVAEANYGKASFVSVDIDQYPAIADQFEVTAIPTIAVINADGGYSTIVGFMDKAEFENFVERNID